MTARKKGPTTVAVNGACGRMGTLIIRLASADPELKVAAALEAPGNANLGQDAGIVAGVGKPVGVTLSEKLDAAVDVMIDFSLPAGTMARVEECRSRGIPMVVGTTGLDEEQLKKVRAAATTIPIVFAPNMSVGVNLLFKLAGAVAKTLGEGYDVEIVEMHHRFKKDAPSGTALKLAESIAEALGRDLHETAVFGREGITGERPSTQIGIHAVRGGDVVGEHTVIFAGQGERVELTHKAQSRETFVRGALRAAKFVVGRKPGLYSMRDVLGL